MVGRIYKTLAVVALAAVVMVGCGKEDVTDLTNTWTAKEGDVQTKLQEVQGKQAELQSRLQSVQVSNTADSATMAKRTIVEQMMQDHQAKIAEIEAKIKEHQDKRTQIAEAGNRAEYEAAWKSAETDYEAALASLDELASQSGTMSSAIDDLSNPPAAVDTTAATGTMNTDTTAASN